MTPAQWLANEIVAELYNRINKAGKKRHLNLIPWVQERLETALREAKADQKEIDAKIAEEFSKAARECDGGWGGTAELAHYFDNIARQIRSAHPDGKEKV